MQNIIFRASLSRQIRTELLNRHKPKYIIWLFHTWLVWAAQARYYQLERSWVTSEIAVNCGNSSCRWWKCTVEEVMDNLQLVKEVSSNDIHLAAVSSASAVLKPNTPHKTQWHAEERHNIPRILFNSLRPPRPLSPLHATPLDQCKEPSTLRPLAFIAQDCVIGPFDLWQSD